MSASDAARAAPECTRCIHYYITHDAAFPYGCRAMNFKSRRLPALEVAQASGTACLAFCAKTPVGEAAAGNRPRDGLSRR